MRSIALNNSKMCYLNVKIAGLSGAPHIALLNIKTTQDVRKLRYHIKFLAGDFLTAERLSLDQGLSPKCRLCDAPVESLDHVLTGCLATAEICRRILPEGAVKCCLPSATILSYSQVAISILDAIYT